MQWTSSWKGKQRKEQGKEQGKEFPQSACGPWLRELPRDALLPAVRGPPLPVRPWGLRPLRWETEKPLPSRLQTLPYLGTDF